MAAVGSHKPGVTPTELSEKTKEIIKATVPVLGEHGLNITSTFYPIMFERYPDAKNLFNQTHQAKGTQPHALAKAVLAYAQNIDNLGALGPAVERIVHRHCVLHIQAHHYDWVGECLIEAIKRTLGALATDDVINAWAEAYWFLAQLLINAEEDTYAAKEAEGQWRGFKEFTVQKKEKESGVIESVFLLPPEGHKSHTKAGQYMSLKLATPGMPTDSILRQYTISNSPARDGYYRLTIRKEYFNEQRDPSATAPPGMMSTFVHDYLQEGDKILGSAPFGTFFIKDEDIHDERPLVLLSSGVGSTPMMSMLREVLADGRKGKIEWFHGARDGSQHAFREFMIQAFKDNSNLSRFVAYSNPLPWDQYGKSYHVKGRLTIDIIKKQLNGNPDCNFYFCGSTPFMEMLLKGLEEWGVPNERIHWESQGPTTLS
jgi:nitric oxide dioxygenase